MTTVFFDVDTQLDFMYPSGALYVPGAESMVDQIACLNRFAGAQGIPLVSTMDAHKENDPEFEAWPPHCVTGCIGQRKPEATLLSRRVVLPNGPSEVKIESGQQILLEKQTFDCFTNMNLPPLLQRFGADRYVVYGVVTEICVRLAATGLLKTGKRVEMVTDAVRSLSDAASANMTTGFLAAGGVLTTISEVTRTS